MIYNFSFFKDVPGEDFSRSYNIDSDSLSHSLKMLAFAVFRSGLSPDYVLCPLYVCTSDRGRSYRTLTGRNLLYYKKCYSEVCDSCIII